MSEQKIELSPLVTPQAYKDQNSSLSGVPNGTGLQIVFNINGENYIFAGPRGGSVLTVNGGTIENQNNPFFTQLAEEMEEETFGALKIVQSHEGYKLVLNGKEHELTIEDNQSFLADNAKWNFVYVTFTAVCKTVTMNELDAAQTLMNPTALFWNKIGNFLFPHTRKAPKDDTFTAYWESESTTRAALIAELGQTDENTLLTKPTEVFGAQTIDQALAKLNDIKSYAELMTMFKHTVGRYSERSGYYVFTTSELVNAANNETIKEVKDYKGNIVASGIFNDSAVKVVLPSFIPQVSAGNSRDSLFATSTTASSSTEQPTVQMHNS